jgi:hypothetical protein
MWHFLLLKDQIGAQISRKFGLRALKTSPPRAGDGLTVRRWGYPHLPDLGRC